MDNSQLLSIETKKSWLDQPIFSSTIINIEKLTFAIILIVAIFTRFYMLEPRVMSHDETSHTYFSWLFFKGQGYAHDPVTHGPLQFHLVALSYFLFGDSDTTARIPAVIFSIATVAFMWNYRRYLGRMGALIAALLFTISPFMLYYGRYVRNEAFVAFFGVVMLWSMLRYMDTAKPKYLYIFTTVTVLHFCTKETSFIYAAQALLFLAIYLVYRLTQRIWIKDKFRSRFIVALISTILLLSLGMLIRMLSGKLSSAGQPQYPIFASIPTIIPIILIVLGIIGSIATIYFALAGFGLGRIREERSFDLLMLLGTLVLPQLSAFGINLFGWKIPVNATEVNALTLPDLLRMAAIVVPIFLVSIVLGLWWNRRQWLINAGIWYVVFIVLYTSMFTNGAGFFTGMVGSLGYWLAQQAVNRGDQPIYYYALIQIPIYEYLPALGSIIGVILATMGRKTIQDASFAQECHSSDEPSQIPAPIESDESDKVLIPLDTQTPISDEPLPFLAKSPTAGFIDILVIHQSIGLFHRRRKNALVDSAYYAADDLAFRLVNRILA